MSLVDQLSKAMRILTNIAKGRGLAHTTEVTSSLKNIARIVNAVPVTLYSRVTVNVEIVVLNCQKCNQCLKGHKSLGLFFEGVLHLSLSFTCHRLCHCLFVGQVMSLHLSDQMSQRS